MITRTPSETLIAALEDFGQHEAKECIVIYTNAAGDLCWSSSTDSLVSKLGMIELAKANIIMGGVSK